MDNEKTAQGGEGYCLILSSNPTDARIYLWSEKAAMIFSVGAFISFLLALGCLLKDFISGDLHTFGYYVKLLIGLPAIFLLPLLASVLLHRKTAHKYGL